MAQKLAGRPRKSEALVKSDAPGKPSVAPLAWSSWRFSPRDFVTGALLVLATLLAYWPALGGGLIWDDAAHITRPELRSLTGLSRIWFELGATQQYYPLLHSAFWVEHRLWGGAVLGYHLANVLLHASAALLVVLIVRRLAIPGAWLAGFIFALHPVCVNAVAWISEQKSTLSAVFYLASALAYLHFDQTRRKTQYALALGLFVLALLAKTVTATLPAALLVVFWWRRGRLDWRRDVRPLIPWLLIGASAGLFTAWVERRFIGAVGPEFSLSLLDRCLLAGRVIWFYFAKLIWPGNLVFIYPHWTIDASIGWQYLFPFAVVVVAAALWSIARRWRGPLAGFLFFAGTLFPVLGFLNVYPFIYSYVADHFQYLASLGIIVPLSAAMALGSERLRLSRRALAWAPAVALLATLGVLTWRQAAIYRDSQTIYRATLLRNPGSWMAHNNLGAELLDVPGQSSEAISHLETALQLKPDSAEAHNNLGKALGRISGRQQDAIAHFEAALRIRPRFPEAENNLGRALSQMGRSQEAIPHFEAALQIRPAFAEAHANLGVALLDLPGRLPDAIAQFKAALEIDPELEQAHNGLGSALADQPDQIPEAIRQFEAALRINPGYAEAHANLGQLFSQLPDRLPDAAREYQAALGIRPDYPEAHNGLGVALSKMGRTRDAITQYEAALRLRPDYPEAHNNLGTALSQIPGRLPEAIPHFEAALRSDPGSAEMQANLGNALSEIPGRLPEAIQHLQAAVRIRPDFAAAHYLLGIALARSPGSAREALAQLEAAQRLQSDPKLQQLIDRLRAGVR
ncbi:MAG TPA: tetratricopeptide repeat protein [Bryobacteraceae bacterium]|nr:tetratricopeptide repeat protein [Bryobacteraceae bacterium]